MTILDAFNSFFQRDLEDSFTSDEVALYMRLLHRANQLRKARFNLAVDKLMMELGMKTKRPFDTARKSLREAGLIDFQNGNGRGCTTEYLLIGLDFQPERGTKKDPLSAPLSDTLSAQIPQRKRNENALLHKTKIKTTKGANAPAVGASSSAKKVPPTTSTEPEPWLAWVLANAPTVQQLKKPLTAEQWAELLATYGEGILHDVLRGMENHPGLLAKYKSAHLTALDWCKRRAKGLPPRPLPPAEADAPLPAPELDPDFQTERAARQQAEEDAHFARWGN